MLNYGERRRNQKQINKKAEWQLLGAIAAIVAICLVCDYWWGIQIG